MYQLAPVSPIVGMGAGGHPMFPDETETVKGMPIPSANDIRGAEPPVGVYTAGAFNSCVI